MRYNPLKVCAMSAWFLALCCLLSSDQSLLRTGPPSTDILVYLAVEANQPAIPVNYMKRELSTLMQAAGFRVIWGDIHNPGKDGQVSNLVVLQLHGVCGLPPGSYRLEEAVASGASLAETSVSSGNVLPFSRVNCANLTRMIGPSLSMEAGAQRDFLYGRAMARVVAHELYHVEMGSRDHGHDGVAKERFKVADLLDDSFGFDTVALARLRQKAVADNPSPHADATGETAAGR